MMRWDKAIRGWRLMLRLALSAAVLNSGGSGVAAAVEERSGGAAGTELQVTPDVVDIGLFDGGAEVQVEADLAAGAPEKLALVLEGAREDLGLKRKGKVWGLLWMNVGDLDFEGIPTVYLLSTSVPLEELASEEVRRGCDIGYWALGAGRGPTQKFFGDLVALKERDGLFGYDPEGIHLHPGAHGGRRLRAVLRLPARLPVGSYRLRLEGFRDGKAVELAESEVLVRTHGVIKGLRTLAFEHGLLYGCTAVLVALIAGFATGIAFGRGSSHGGH